MTINRIAGYRRMLNMTQADMANYLGIGITAYNHKEQGKSEFRDKEKIKLLELLKQVDDSLTIEALFF